jgi:hypothetical protein
LSAVVLAIFGGMAGCAVLPPQPAPTVAPPPLSQTVPPGGVVAASAVNSPALGRVQEVGNKLLSANPQLGLRPKFVVPATARFELSHQTDQRLTISDGLVGQCATDGQLAALLSWEMGRMVGEREARIRAEAVAEREPPPEVRIGPDVGAFGAVDQTRYAELSKLGFDRRRPKTAAPAPPDPKVVARETLAKAGYAEAELDGVAPLLAMMAAPATRRIGN